MEELPKFFPVVGLKISNKCRMRCQFCCEGKQKYKQFDFENYKIIIKKLQENGTKRICFTGGEPLMCSFLGETLKLSHELNLNNVIFTSDGEKLQILNIPKEYIDSLRISLHAIGSMHDEIVQKKGAFKDIEDSIDRLNDIGYNLSINTVIIPEMVDSVEKIIEWGIEKKFKSIYLSNLLQSGLGEDFIKKSGRITDNDFAKLVNNLKNKYGKRIKIISHPYEKNAECILMYGNGDIYVDPYFKSETHQKYIGNILDADPQKVFNNFMNSGKVWDDYLIRLNRSTLYN